MGRISAQPQVELNSGTRGGIFSPFMQMYLTCGLSTWALGSGLRFPPSFQSHSPLSQHRSLTACYWSEESFPLTQWFSLEIHVMGKREELRSNPPVQYLNNRSHRWNLSSTPGQGDLCSQMSQKDWRSSLPGSNVWLKSWNPVKSVWDPDDWSSSLPGSYVWLKSWNPSEERLGCWGLKVVITWQQCLTEKLKPSEERLGSRWLKVLTVQ